jgi:acyl carrier protein
VLFPTKPSVADAALKKRLKEILIQATGLDITPNEIGDDIPLTKFGVDSMAVLEVIVALETEFGVSITDMETGMKAFASINSLAKFVEKNRT